MLCLCALFVCSVWNCQPSFAAFVDGQEDVDLEEEDVAVVEGDDDLAMQAGGDVDPRSPFFY